MIPFVVQEYFFSKKCRIFLLQKCAFFITTYRTKKRQQISLFQIFELIINSIYWHFLWQKLWQQSPSHSPTKANNIQVHLTKCRAQVGARYIIWWSTSFIGEDYDGIMRPGFLIPHQNMNGWKHLLGILGSVSRKDEGCILSSFVKGRVMLSFYKFS